jgi:phospholipid/cholesterol/gamma-HCH transport system permease protein
LLERFNDAAKRKIQSLQEFFVLGGKAIGFAFTRPFYKNDLIQQMDSIGVQSLPILLLTGFFT